jgi:hypothetical protein
MYFSMLTEGTTARGFIIPFSCVVEQAHKQHIPASVRARQIFSMAISQMYEVFLL